MSLDADSRRIVRLASEACAAVVAGQHGAAREWLRLLAIEVSRLDVALAGIHPAVPNPEQEINTC